MSKVYELPTKIRVAIHRDENGLFWAESSDVPHCYTQGKTLDETMNNMKDAIFTHYEISAKASDPKLLKTETELSAEFRFASS